MCAGELAGTVQTRTLTALAGRLVTRIDVQAVALIESFFEYSSHEEWLASAIDYALDLMLFNGHLTTLGRSHAIDGVWGKCRQWASSMRTRPIPGAYFTGTSASTTCGYGSTKIGWLCCGASTSCFRLLMKFAVL
ncbi:hypothetical protein CVS37_26965 [Burkholderia lata]|nr:hypothetical protein CVS37_26965 [Burkholderia lata]